MAYVESDAEFSKSEDNAPYSNDGGPYYFNWSGVSSHEEPWVDWYSRSVSSKWPDSALYQKMLKIAQALSTHVQDDDGTHYEELSDCVLGAVQQVSANSLRPVTNATNC